MAASIGTLLWCGADCYSMLGAHSEALAGYTWCCETARAKVHEHVGDTANRVKAALVVGNSSRDSKIDSDGGDERCSVAADAENRRALLGMCLHGLAGHLERTGSPGAAIAPLREALGVAMMIETGHDLRIVDCYAR